MRRVSKKSCTAAPVRVVAGIAMVGRPREASMTDAWRWCVVMALSSGGHGVDAARRQDGGVVHSARIAMDIHPRLPRPLRLAVVTETYPPEINGVAATIASTVAGLRVRGHQVQLVRPWQGGS